MRNVLKYYYNLSFDKIEEHGDYAVLKNADDVYIFKKYLQDESETKYIVSLLISYNIPIHLIVYNKDNSLITFYDGERYILLKLQSVSHEIDNDFLFLAVPKRETDIGDLWAKKVDYYMQQIRELGLGKELLINSFNYYVGMAENAISIYNRTKLMGEEAEYTIAHRRIYYPNYAINYLDPTNMIVDIRVRDIASYVKAKYFEVGVEVDELLRMVYKYNLNNKEINFLYARLLYPTYYFDVFEDAIISDNEDERILKILDKRIEYESFLAELVKRLKSEYQIFEIEWLKK